MFYSFPAFASPRSSIVERWADAAERAYAGGRFSDASELFRQICSARPDDRYNFVCYVDSLWLAGRDAEAERETISFAGVSPLTAEGFFLTGTLASHCGDLAGAEISFREALARMPDSTRMRIALAVLLVRSERAAEGLREAATVADNPDAASDVRYVAGLAYRMAGREREALRWFEAALALRPDDLFAATEVYASHRMLGESPTASLFFRESPDFPMRRVLDALFDGLFAGLNRKEHIERMRQIGREGAQTGPTLVLLLAVSGHHAEAALLSERLLAKRPYARFTRLAAAAAFAGTDARRARSFLLDAFQPGADLFHPYLFLRIAERFPSLSAQVLADIRRNLTSAPPVAPPFPLLPKTLRPSRN